MCPVPVSVARRLYHKGIFIAIIEKRGRKVSVARRLYHKGIIRFFSEKGFNFVSVARRLYHKGIIVILLRASLIPGFRSPAGSIIKEFALILVLVMTDSFRSPAGSIIKEFFENKLKNKAMKSFGRPQALS